MPKKFNARIQESCYLLSLLRLIKHHRPLLFYHQLNSLANHGMYECSRSVLSLYLSIRATMLVSTTTTTIELCRPAGGHSSSCDGLQKKVHVCCTYVFVLSDVPWVDTAANTLCRDQSGMAP